MSIENSIRKDFTYVKDMWLGFDSIQTYFTNERNKVKNLLYVITEYKNIQYEYAQNLEHLTTILSIYSTSDPQDSNSPSTETSYINRVTSLLLLDLKKRSELIFSVVNDIENDIIIHLNSVLEEQFQKSQNLSKQFFEHQNTFKDIADEIENRKLKFNSATVIAEGMIIKLQKTKGKNYTNEELIKYKESQDMKIKFAQNLEKEYYNFIADANKGRDIYISKTSEIMNTYEYLEIELNYLIYNKLLYFWMIMDEYDKSMAKYRTDFLSTYKSLDVREDLEVFIKANATNYSIPAPFVFIPYTSVIQNKIAEVAKQKNVSQDNLEKYTVFKCVWNVINMKFNRFKTEKTSALDPKEEVISSSVKNIWESKDINNAEIKLWLSEKQYREYFWNCVNLYRVEGRFFIPEKGFYIICELMNEWLWKAKVDGDYENIKLCMILSQTFSLESDSNKWLENGINSNEIWDEKQTWIELIKYSIQEEMSNQNGYVSFLNQTNKDRKQRWSSAAFTNMMNFWFNMKNFGYPKEKAIEVVKFFGEKYNVDYNSIIDVDLEEPVV